MNDYQNFNSHQGPNPNLSQKTEKSSIEPTSGLQAGIGLAVTSLVLGLMSLPLAFFVIGAGAGFIGLIIGIIHLSQKRPFRAMAVWGLVLSAIGLVGGTGLGVFYGISFYRGYSMMQDMEDHQFDEYIGQTAPDITVTDLEGNGITLSELKGKRVVLDFWATWCPPCTKEIPHLIRLRQTVDSNELVIVGISDESADEIKTFGEKNRINYPLVSIADKELPDPFNRIVSLPTTFFIDRDGKIESVLSGYHSFEELKKHSLKKNKEQLQALVEEHLKGSNVDLRGNVDDLFSLADLYMDEGDQEKASDLYEQALKVDGWRLEYQLKYANLLEKRGYKDQAIEKAKIVFQYAEDEELIEKAQELFSELGELSDNETIMSQTPASDIEIIIVPIGEINQKLLTEIKSSLQEKMGIRYSISEKMLPLEAIDRPYNYASPNKGQHNTEKLLDELKKSFKTTEDSNIKGYLGITEADIFTKDYNFLYGWARNGYGVMSYHRFRAAFTKEPPNRPSSLSN